MIETVEDDHIILAKDGITYWLDECDDMFESEEEAVACLKKKKTVREKTFGCQKVVVLKRNICSNNKTKQSSCHLPW